MKFFTEGQIEKIREGFYQAVYFKRTQQILLDEKNLSPVTMQVFQKKEAILAGIAPVIELFKFATGYVEKNLWINKANELQIQALTDGDVILPWETIMHIHGPLAYFAHLESVYLGILARCTKIATNTKHVVTAANGKQVLFFADRFDYFGNQELDGYSAKIGGVSGVATPAQANLWEGNAMGTIPHALIAIHNGSTLEAAKAFVKEFPNIPLIVLVDFENDCVKTTLEIAKHFGDKLYGVRLDTSETLIDKSLLSEGVTRVGGPQKVPAGSKATDALYGGDERQDPERNIRGVNALLVKNVRQALDQKGFRAVKIVVSGGFNAEKIEQFEKENVPVDIYGVGSSLLKNAIDFTADVVKVDGKNIAKVGREYSPNKKLQVIDTK